jgi:hypothetical protein
MKAFNLCMIFYLSKILNCYYLPQINLGEVDLSKNPKCELEMQPYLTKCTVQYRKKVESAMKLANYDINSELVQRATCCGVWIAKYCVSRAVRSIKSCGIVEARAFEKLPIDSEPIAIINKHCDGYYYASKVCSMSQTINKTNYFLVVIIFFIISII